MITHHMRVGIRGIGPGGKEDRELGWLGWSILDDISRDGHKILFEEVATAVAQITPSFSATPTPRLQPALAKETAWRFRPTRNG